MRSASIIEGRSWQSLRWRLTLVIAGWCLLVMAIVLYATTREVKSTGLSVATSRAENSGTQVADLFSRSALQTLEQLRRAVPAVRGAVQDPSPETLAAARAALAPFGASTRRVTLWTRQGQLILSLPDTPGTASVPAPPAPPSPGIGQAQADGDRAITDAAVVVTSEGPGTPAPIGILAIRSVLSISPPDLLDRLIGSGARVKFGNRSGTLWTDGTRVVEGPRIDATRDGGHTYMGADGDERIGAISAVPGTPWVVWVEFSGRVVGARANVFVQRMLTFGAVLGLAILLMARWFAAQLTTPLAAMTEAVEAVAGGDYTTRVPAGRGDEIGRLGRAFNAMSDRVAGAHHELERRVDERTQDLNAALDELERSSKQRERASEGRYRTLFEYAPDGILIADGLGTYLDANPAMCRMVGYSREEIVGGNAALIIAGGDIPHIDSTLQAIAADSPRRREWQLRRRDGSVFAADVIATQMPDDTLVGMVRDVTERNKSRQLEAQYQQAQKMDAIGRLAGGVAHDFNNLLTVILGNCEMLATTTSEARALRHVIGVERAANQAAALTQQLLAFSRKQVIEPTLVDLNTLIADFRRMLGRLIGEDITVVVDLPEGVAPVLADRNQIQQVVMNLAVNARDAMPSGGVLTIQTANVELDEQYVSTHFGAKVGPHVALTVSDTGIGMSADVQARLFEPFFTTKDVGKGTGIGLATVHGIVASSGGSIGVYSEAGKGTSFKVYFPRADVAAHAQAAPPPAQAAPLRGGTETVLVVEDAEVLRGVARELLERQGYTVLVAANADEALAIFDQQPKIDVLLTDVVMPGASGPELTAQLKSRRPDLKVVYMSGYTEEAIGRHGVSSSADAFLHKPFTSETLGRKLRDALAST